MKFNLRFLVIPALVAGSLVAGSQAASAADITGTVTLNGKPPASLDLPITPECSKARGGEVLKQKFYVVGPKGEYKDVVVFLKNMSGKSTGASAQPIVLDQKGCEYVPTVAAVQTGQKIIIKNSDPFNHNVDAMPAKDGNRPFNKMQAPGSPDLTTSFSAEENFLRVKCDIHPWMITYVNVFDHPYFAVTDAEGKFKISNVPAGKYTIEAWHRKSGKIDKEVEVKADGAVVDFTMEVPK